MKAIFDAHYRNSTATVACVQFAEWTDSQPSAVDVTQVEVGAEYVAGMFFRRELPCLLRALEQMAVRFEVIIVDGYVHLKPPMLKGLGARLAESVGYPVAVVGVAKSPLKVADRFTPVLRGKSRRPIFVSAIHLPTETAARHVKRMSGPFRIPTLIRLADQTCRNHLGR